MVLDYLVNIIIPYGLKLLNNRDTMKQTIRALKEKIKLKQRIKSRRLNDLELMIRENRHSEMRYATVISSYDMDINKLNDDIKWVKFIYYCNTGKLLDDNE